MRGLLPTPNLTQPYVVVVVYDKTTDAPMFALSNFGAGVLDTDTVKVNGVFVDVKFNIDGIEFREDRPTTLGAGLHRREVAFNIHNSGPFATAPFSSRLYSAGATVDNFYFSVWVTDFTLSLEDIVVNGLHLGYYDLDAGVGWEESSLITSIKLVDRLTALTGRYNNNTEAAEDILAGSEWQRLLDAPAYLGHRAKVPAYGRTSATISGFEAYNKAVKAVIAGLVQSSELSGTSIQLGKSPTLGSIVGTLVRLKMGNGCIIRGTITDLGGGEYGIDTTGLTLNVAWDNILVYNKGWTAIGAALGTANTDLTSVFIDNTYDLTYVPSPTMYLKSAGTVELYNAGPVTTASALFLKLTGIKDEANKELGCEQLKDPANPTWKYGGISVEFDAAQQTSAWTGDDAHLNYAKWLGKQTCGLYFSSATFTLADIQVAGMPWELIVTDHVNSSVPISHDYYIRLMGSTTLAESESGNYAIYADNGKTLTAIPNTEITSITYDSGEFGMPDLCKIHMKRRLTDINEAYDENMLYVDTSNVIHAGEVITYILAAAGINEPLRDYTLRTGTNAVGNPMSLVVRDETWTELLDSVVFESGLRISTQKGFYVATTAFTQSDLYTFNNAADPTQMFCYATTTAVVDFADVIDGTYKIGIGRMLTNIDADNREFVRTHYSLQYQFSEYGGNNLRKLQSTKAAKNNDRIVDYTFKHINDTQTATAAALQMSRIGHPANIPETTRVVTVGLPLSYLNYEALDSIRLASFRHITAENDPLPAYNDASTTNPTYTLGRFGPYGRYTTTTPYLLLPGIGIVDSIRVNLSGEGVPVELVFKQVQVGTTSNLKSVAERITMPTPDANTATEDEGGVVAGTYGKYYCPKEGTVLKVNIEVPSTPLSGTAVLDACCNTNTSDGTIEGDPITTVVCSAPCTDASGKRVDCPDSEWPDGCIDRSNIYHEPVTTNTISSTDPVLFEIYTFNDWCPFLVEIKYPGKREPDPCVTFAHTCIGTQIGILAVYPCAFDKPEDLYVKPIGMTFTVPYCDSPLPAVIGGPRVNKYHIKKVHIVIPVVLRPVSDITLG